MSTSKQTKRPSLYSANSMSMWWSSTTMGFPNPGKWHLQRKRHLTDRPVISVMNPLLVFTRFRPKIWTPLTFTLQKFLAIFHLISISSRLVLLSQGSKSSVNFCSSLGSDLGKILLNHQRNLSQMMVEKGTGTWAGAVTRLQNFRAKKKSTCFEWSVETLMTLILVSFKSSKKKRTQPQTLYVYVFRWWPLTT